MLFRSCDEMKARELAVRASQGHYQKPLGEDLLSLVKGLGEFKGRVVLRFGDTLDPSCFSEAEDVAQALDRQILNNYELYDSNYHALFLHNPRLYTEMTGHADNQHHDERFAARLQRCEELHQPLFLAMYANPAISKWQQAQKST